MQSVCCKLFITNFGHVLLPTQPTSNGSSKQMVMWWEDYFNYVQWLPKGPPLLVLRDEILLFDPSRSTKTTFPSLASQ